MRRLGLSLAAFLLLVSSAGFSQAPHDVAIEPLLRNPDPRLVAFGAYETLRRHDENGITLLVGIVEHWTPDTWKNQDASDAHDALTAVLDAVIQMNENVSPAAIRALAPRYPDQALILAARLPNEDREMLFRAWYQGGKDAQRFKPDAARRARLLLARVSAMMLAADRAGGFAADILADSEERLAVSVINTEGNPVPHCLMDCENQRPCRTDMGYPPKSGWPPFYQYQIEENSPSAESDQPLVEAGDEHITYRREKAEMELSQCFVPRPLDAATRHQLLAEMLDVPVQAIPWGEQMNFTVPWIYEGQFFREISKQIDAQEKNLRATVRAFHAKGLLTDSEFAATRPRLEVIVFDDRVAGSTPNPAIPQYPAADSRTSYEIKR